ncbi:MAG: hypothetical protein OXE98_10210 [Hyphomicrobiales bacterium]|nr:hypothetical protein [Hyphomicrobiales bacterium]MCY4054231.1 hypothetical protein [Hyphomicrobiales bacterium]
MRTSCVLSEELRGGAWGVAIDLFDHLLRFASLADCAGEDGEYVSAPYG